MTISRGEAGTAGKRALTFERALPVYTTMLFLRRRAPLLLTTAILASSTQLHCGGDSSAKAPPGARFNVVSPGSGDSNAEPLLPLRVGSVLRPTNVDANPSFSTIEDAGEIGGAPAVGVFASGSFELYAKAADGVFRIGASGTGLDPHPALVVPATVRVGMTWDVFGDGDQVASTFTVESREAQDTATGPRIVWRILRRFASHAPDERATYWEGRGDGDRMPAVFPLDDVPVESVTPMPVALEPMKATIDTGEDQVIGDGGSTAKLVAYYSPLLPFSMVHAKGAAEALILSHGPRGFDHCIKTDGSTIRRGSVNGTNTGKFATNEGDECAGFISESPPVTRLGDATATLVGDRVYWMAVVAGGYVSGRERAIIGFDGKTPELLSVNDERLFGAMRVGSGESFGGAFDASKEYTLDDTLVGINRDLVRVYPFPGKDSKNAELLVMANDGRLWSASLVDGNLSAPRLETTLGATLSPQMSVNGMDLLAVAPNGRIDELVPTRDGLMIRHLADVGLPGGELAYSAFRVSANGDPSQTTLVVITLLPGSQVGFDATHPKPLSYHVWRAPHFQPTPQPLIRPRVFGISTSSADGLSDMKVCWPKGGGKLSADGWTLGRTPPLAVLEANDAGTCALIVRDGSKSPSDASQPFQNFVTATVPGIGRVELATGTDLVPGSPRLYHAFDTDREHYPAPLSGGGWASPFQRFDRDQTPMMTWGGVIDTGSPDWVADAAGNGSWRFEPSIPGNQPDLLALNGRSKVLRIARPDGEKMLAAAGGGLILWLTAKGVGEYVAPDGSITPLKLPAGKIEQPVLCGGRKDGVYCAQFSGTAADYTITCVRPDGTQRSIAFDDPCNVDFRPTAPLPDGSFVVPTQLHGVMRIDPDAGVASKIDPRFLYGVRLSFAPDGTVWGVAAADAASAGKGGTVVRVTSTGVTDVQSLPLTFNPTAIFVDDSIIRAEAPAPAQTQLSPSIRFVRPH